MGEKSIKPSAFWRDSSGAREGAVSRASLKLEVRSERVCAQLHLNRGHLSVSYAVMINSGRKQLPT